MLDIFSDLRNFTMLSVTLRLILAVACGGLIGMERTIHRQSAGLRTHILVCLGATITMMTGQYLYLYMGYFTDMTRLGAQVIAGIGFLGAGTIVASRQRVKGLTTAAGLWASAVIGLAVGAGFFEGAIITLFIKLERFLVRRTAAVRVFMEYNRNEALDEVVFFCHSDGRATITNLEINRPKEPKNVAIAMFTVRLSRDIKPQELIHAILAIDGVILAELV